MALQVLIIIGSYHWMFWLGAAFQEHVRKHMSNNFIVLTTNSNRENIYIIWTPMVARSVTNFGKETCVSIVQKLLT